MVKQGLIKKSKIATVWFDADQYRFDPQAFPFLNEHADLLFAVLLSFSHEGAPIVRHDESRAFAPQQVTAPSG
jgi:hypothetical protein